MTTTRRSGSSAPPAGRATKPENLPRDPVVEGEQASVPVAQARESGLASLSTNHTVFTYTPSRRQTSLHTHRRAVHKDRADRYPESET
jgi:hypothetical protein